MLKMNRLTRRRERAWAITTWNVRGRQEDQALNTRSRLECNITTCLPSGGSSWAGGAQPLVAGFAGAHRLVSRGR